MNPKSLSVTVPGTDEILEILVKRVDQQKQARGMVVGVIERDGRRRVVRYGKLADDDPRTVDGDTIFEIGSITKVFTSLLLADMVSRNEVALDDPAAKYVPKHVRVPERNGKSITLLDLATHRSGLPFMPGNLRMNFTQGQTIDAANPHGFYGVDDLYQFLSGYTLPRDPGTEFEYSNVGAGLLGHLLANRSGTDYESLIRTRITQPLGMPDTGIALSCGMKDRMATGHKATLAPIAAGDWGAEHGLAGAGALRSSVNDMLTLLEGFLGFGKTIAGFRAGQGRTGIGWLIYDREGREIAWHNGATAGFRSFAGYDPRERIGVVVLANACTPSGVDDIGFHLLNSKLPVVNPEPPKVRSEIRIDPKLLEGYTGRFQVTPALVFEITREGDGLFAQGFAQVSGQSVVLPRFEVFAESEKRFFAKVSDNQITFETGPDGRATRLILHRAGRDMPAARISP